MVYYIYGLLYHVISIDLHGLYDRTVYYTYRFAWLPSGYDEQFATERSTMFKNGKPSISIRAMA